VLQTYPNSNTGTTVTYNSTGLTPNTQYYYKIETTHTDGCNTAAITSIKTLNNNCGASGTFSIPKSCNSIDIATTTGTEAEWNIAPWEYVTQQASGALRRNSNWPVAGRGNAAARWKMLYDDEGFIYVYADIYDSQQPANSHCGWVGAPGDVHPGWGGSVLEIYLNSPVCTGNNPLQIGIMYCPGTTPTPAYRNQHCGTTLAGYDARII
jgi:hypothetical protein